MELRGKHVVMACVVILLAIIGYGVTPYDGTDRPLLLLPDIREAQEYRRAAQRWVTELHQMDSQIEQILEQEDMDLLTNVRQGQRAFEDAVQLLQEIDETEVPPTAMVERDHVARAAMSYFEAANAALRWISAPTETNKTVAQEQLEKARTVLADLERDSAWMTK